MLEDDQAGAAADHASVLSDVTPAVVRGHGRGHATAPSTTTTTTGGRASSTNKTNTATSGSSTGSALSSARRSASSALSTSSPLTSLSERARPARTPRTDEAAASVDGDGPEEISELMTLITQRLNRKLDNKKRKLESMAEQALQQVQRTWRHVYRMVLTPRPKNRRAPCSAYRGAPAPCLAEALKEHVRTHCDALVQQQAEHQRKMDALYATAAEDTHLMRQLQANYVVGCRSARWRDWCQRRPDAMASRVLPRLVVPAVDLFCRRPSASCWPRARPPTRPSRRRKSIGSRRKRL